MEAPAGVALKLALVGASVLLSSLAARRFGHAVGGTLAGLPMIFQRPAQGPAPGSQCIAPRSPRPLALAPSS